MPAQLRPYPPLSLYAYLADPPRRLTQSGACASCGAYGGSAHSFACKGHLPPPVERIRRGRFRGAARDARLSALILEQERLQNALVANL